MITFIAKMRVSAANQPAYEAILDHVRDQTRANEPGVVYYDWAKAVDDPERYVVVEVYADPAAHTTHMATPWVRDSLPESVRLVDGGFDIQQFVTPGGEPAVRQFKAG